MPKLSGSTDGETIGEAGTIPPAGLALAFRKSDAPLQYYGLCLGEPGAELRKPAIFALYLIQRVARRVEGRNERGGGRVLRDGVFRKQKGESSRRGFALFDCRSATAAT